jgi:stage V sporulation protein G
MGGYAPTPPFQKTLFIEFRKLLSLSCQQQSQAITKTIMFNKEEKIMQITDIKIRKIITEGRLKAVISITIDDMLAVHDIKVVQGDERLFVAMPSRKDENGLFRDIVHPISPSAREMLENEILDEYARHIALLEAEQSDAETSQQSSQ